ncbi:MAG TPA: hypothetical protein DIU15_16675 [Deltaproteobacteria bacterium]|nr:hypothetical protein [Deltaproteobacteria bacterium]HCP47678.1 hypothetical protein [Deltaproteobacteria bacterium]
MFESRFSLSVLPFVLGSLLFGCATEPEGAGKDDGSDLSAILLEDDAVGGQLSSANQIVSDEGNIKLEQAKFLELAEKFEQRTGRKLSGVSLNADEAALLNTMLSREEDISLKGLLNEILDTRKTIASLEGHIDELKSQLPTPDIVKRGDTHSELAIDYLVKNHGLDRKEAGKLARRSLLTENIATGMEVWHFYADGVYGTTVTQGSARVSPYFLNVRSRRKLREERDEALALAASLEAEITVLEATRDQLRTDLSQLQDRHVILQEERDVLYTEKEDLVTSDESVFFYVDTKRRLREQDILAPAGMRLKEWRKDLFTQKIDLRYQSTLKVYAEDFGVRRFKRILLLPRKRFIEDEDYRVEYREDRTVAVIQLEDIDKFKNDAFVVVLK